ncbi:beta-glucosidase [Tengunoibacter tsumagoiensis]|uniref:Probable beta-glucosidase G n=1 Tax=Tengunoibacter tsumagoiensis TaxID=2014871 RepID=A0A402A4L4_9CHLR|nr:glycoside hydrolase family 3 C-terminal domain-containing protein [Tengunoibacter tsumagoiensis]GCE14088.1 hypothetical protein KTT_39470 [Tengunoibacter tsumagoiensis]
MRLTSLRSTKPFWVLCLVFLLGTTISVYTPLQANAQQRPWLNKALSADQRALLLLKVMTLTEKIDLLHGVAGPYVGNVAANNRLGIPALHLEDGPAGVADGMTGVTAFPAPISVSASWDPSLMYQYGQATANEEAGKGVNIQLGPTVNILRIPQWGRSFESLGEDPYLTSQMAVSSIQGIQSQGVIATVKHFAANNQEYNRETISAAVDERTLHEIYLPAFEAAVKQGQVGSVMCAYNRVNTVYACENSELLNQILKQDWGFAGFVVSDWQATHSTQASAQNGLDLEMPDGAYYNADLLKAVQSGRISRVTIDDHVLRILRMMFTFGLFDETAKGSPNKNVMSSAHTQLARTAAEEGTVLLQNAGQILPLKREQVKSIAVIGEDGSLAAVGNGSAHVHLPYLVTPLQGIQSAIQGNKIKVTYTSGKKAAQLAKAADVAIVFVNDHEDEGSDRPDLSLPRGQDKLVQTVAQANPHTIVVLNTGAPVSMPWVHQVQGIIEAWYPGQEDGNAIASILFGDVNPSGKLPMTFPVHDTDVPAKTTVQYPGQHGVAQYNEGIFVGYRYYDQQQITPLFPFGYGLSYTTFAYSNLALSSPATATGQVAVNVDITNTGTRAGSEVMQLYVGLPSGSVSEPPEQLKGFKKVTLDAGQMQHVRFMLDERALSYWNVARHDWALAQGNCTISLGSSSRDIRLQGHFTIS